jgi:NADH-quinone oxidoreductase subunit J
MIQEATFWGFGSFVLICSFLVIHTRNIFRSALMLVASFLGVAAIFFMLRAEFLGVIQVLVYVGAIAILILFGIMMTRDSEQGNLPSGNRFLGTFVGTAIGLLIAFVAVNTTWELISSEGRLQLESLTADSTQIIGGLLLNQFVLPFEVVSVVLLAAIIGALAVVRD